MNQEDVPYPGQCETSIFPKHVVTPIVGNLNIARILSCIDSLFLSVITFQECLNEVYQHYCIK